MTKRFSVAMCTYNGARFVGEQLASMAAQTRRADELVVCDDHSTDETVGIIEQFAASAPFPVRLHVNERNVGSTRNFEKAIRLCAGELIALADQDDVWMPRKLELVEAEFERSASVGLVFTDAEVVDERLQPLGYRLWQSINFGQHEQKKFREGAAFEWQFMQNVVTGATMAFRSSFRDLVLPLYETGECRYGMPHWNMIHDGWIALLIAAAADVVPVAEPLIKYRQHPQQQQGINSPASQARKPAPDWRARAAEQYKEFFARELKLLGTVRDRLAAKRGAFDCEAAVAALNARINHMRARASLPKSKLSRIPVVFKELMSLRYFRYSNGASSAAKDLLL